MKDVVVVVVAMQQHMAAAMYQTKKGKLSIWQHFGFVKKNDGFVDKTRVACKLCPSGMILLQI